MPIKVKKKFMPRKKKIYLLLKKKRNEIREFINFVKKKNNLEL